VENSKTLPFVEIKLDGGEWFASRTGRFTAAERGRDNDRRLGGPQSQPERGVGEIVLHPRQESNPSILVV
jgi:hypothetical protein